MPYKFEQFPINNPKNDKRVKLTDEDRIKIKAEYEAGGISQRGLADKYKVSRRLIQFIINPERLEHAKKLYAERRKDGRYYDKEKHTEAVRKHRNHKKELWNKGLLNKSSEDDN